MSKLHFSKFAVLTFLTLMALSSASMAQSAFDDPGSRMAGATGGDLRPVNDKITGDVSLGSSSQIVILLRNEDNKPITTGAINLYPSSNISASIGENQCAAAEAGIAPGEICAISLQVKGLQQGGYRIEMLMRHNGRSKLLTSTISGNVQTSGDSSKDLISDVETIPSEVDFGSLNESRTQVKSVVLRNITSQPIKISEISVEAGAQSGFSTKENCEELQTGEACVVAVTWAPMQKGDASGVVVVRHTGATGVATVELKGQYDPSVAEAAKVFPESIPGKGLLISSKEEVDFGTGVEQSSSMTVSLVNSGDTALTLTGIRMANTENGIKVENRGCTLGSVLSPLEACPLTLTWEPVREGSIFDDVQIAHTGARGVLVLPLRGIATKAVNKNNKAIMLGDSGEPDDDIMRNITPLSLDDIVDGELRSAAASEITSRPASEKTSSASKEGAAPVAQAKKQPDLRGALDGYTITSYSAKRAIVSGPGGSRVVFENEQTVIGGVLWEISMRPSAVEFRNGAQKVLLLFDRSLSSVNSVGSQSGNTSGSAASTTTSTTSTQ